MNYRLVGFSGLVIAAAGMAIGLAAAEMSRHDFESQFYQNLPTKLAIAGGVFGAATGAGIEAVRQLKQQQDREWQDD